MSGVIVIEEVGSQPYNIKEMSSRLKEALEHMKAAEKALKTSFFQWSPDYDSAASEYTKAATNFKLGGSPEKAKEAFIKAAEMHEKLGSLFHSAKLLTQAGSIAADLKLSEDVVQLMEKASSLYRQHGSNDTAAMTLSKAGKMCEFSLPDKAVYMYLRAAELCENDDKLREAADHLNQVVRMELCLKRCLKSADTMKKRIEILIKVGNFDLCHSITLGLVIVYLSESDYVAADNAYKAGFELKGFGNSDQAMYCEHFLKAFEEGDADLLAKTKKQPTVTHLDTELARLAKSLKLSEVDVPTSSLNDASELEAYEDSESKEERQEEQDTVEVEDFEGGLC